MMNVTMGRLTTGLLMAFFLSAGLSVVYSVEKHVTGANVVFRWAPVKNPEFGRDDIDLKAAANEVVQFKVWAIDKDKKRDYSSAYYEPYPSAEWEHKWAITGKAEFDNGRKDYLFVGGKGGPINVTIDSDFSGEDVITVELNIKDVSTKGKHDPPNIGEPRDSWYIDDEERSVGIQKWVITTKEYCPDSIALTAPVPTGDWYTVGQEYTQKVSGNHGPYEGCTIQEEVTFQGSNLDVDGDDSHLTETAKQPGESQSYWEGELWGSFSTSSFRVDSNDEFKDQHGEGWAEKGDLLQPPSQVNDKLNYYKLQEYKCSSENGDMYGQFFYIFHNWDKNVAPNNAQVKKSAQ